MKRIKAKQVVSVLLMVCVLVSLSTVALADNATSGYCGEVENYENVTWNYSNGTLTLSGTGEVARYGIASNVPWNYLYREITTVIIGDGITSTGWMTFDHFINMTNVSIPDTVTDIGDSAFVGCRSLTSVAIPKGVTNLGANAFAYCTGLTTIDIPDSMTSIGLYSFMGCTGLTSVTIPATVTEIEIAAFRGCTGLTDVYYGGSEAQWNAITIDSENEYLTSATIHYNGSTSSAEQSSAGSAATVSAWASSDVEKASAMGIIPADLPSDYTKAITRADFCSIATEVYKYVTGSDITASASFTDTNDEAVSKMASIGVVTGYGDGRFGPDDAITREQAAAILVRLSEYISGEAMEESAAGFTDSISDWAQSSVNKVYGAGIMSGYSDTQFGGADSYTIEQSIVTMLRTISFVNA
ncbi:MAG: leucine-rich repeat protein [Oscillospiraceae bacterium]|nr:leucine-rich repeat protein [Oscillospiraceae bacterium]